MMKYWKPKLQLQLQGGVKLKEGEPKLKLKLTGEPKLQVTSDWGFMYRQKRQKRPSRGWTVDVL